jgi:hypothetical protein
MRVTKKDFEFFKEECGRFINVLGLKEWSIHYTHESLDDAYARTMMDSNNMVTTMILGTYWDDMRPKTDHEISKLAFHEVCHLLMNPLATEAMERYTTDHALQSLEHTIIRRLENLV